MTTKRIVFNKSDGSGIAVDMPMPSKVQELMDGGMTEAEALDHIAKRTHENSARYDPDGNFLGYTLDADYSIIEASELPSRRFRGAWKRDANKKPVVDMTKIDTPLSAEIHAEASRRIDAVTGDDRAQKQAMARGSGLNAKVAIKGNALTPEEMAEADALIAVGDWVKAVRDEAERFIKDDLPLLTEDEKLNFNPATHPKLKWPAQP